ncbi:MAG: methyltransferase domain-containing protein [Aquificaceae bacterium]|nr:methyltransferase domain-containing protein [Aquificaceae bacterium]MDW8237117.1 rRNA adenine N-6-methyltransferase family protein [Aquificaceae bacterium]
MSFKEGDYILIFIDERKYLKKLSKDFSLSYRGKTIRFEDIIDKSQGSYVNGFLLLKPTLEEIILYGFERGTQILYPKDSFYCAFKLGLNENKSLLEFGTGVGAATAVFYQLCKNITTIELRQEFQSRALKNWERFGLCKEVKSLNCDFLDANLESSEFDCAFIDVKNPTDYLDKLRYVLKPGANVAWILPTANQVSSLLSALKGFDAVEVLEILLRNYKTNPDRLRPEDNMIAHTGYLVFARKSM